MELDGEREQQQADAIEILRGEPDAHYTADAVPSRVRINLIRGQRAKNGPISQQWRAGGEIVTRDRQVKDRQRLVNARIAMSLFWRHDAHIAGEEGDRALVILMLPGSGDGERDQVKIVMVQGDRVAQYVRPARQSPDTA